VTNGPDLDRSDAATETYTHGHHPSVVRSHARRTASNSAAYLIHALRPGVAVLDVGCGPGTITVDFAELVAPGRVLGVDSAGDVVAEACRLGRERGVPNVRFEVADVYDLGLEEGSFDVVHAHQVLQHLRHPVAALVEMQRVLKPDGVLGVRDADYGGFVWGPDNAEIEAWMALYHQVTARNGGQADAGRYLLGWVQQAGFVDAVAGSSTWTFADPDSRAWWGGTWAERVEHSALAGQALDYGLADRDGLERMADGWRRWAEAPDGFFAVVHVEVLARRPRPS
jgi:ubiquinone/menaquinone biosynthesis C-methylase UbiE